MDEKEFGTIKGWFAGRLPDGWFTGVEVTLEDDQVVVLGTLPELKNVGSTSEEKEGAAAGRIARFREETRGERIGIAQEAEERFKKYVTWGAKLGGVTKRFNPGGGGGSSADRRVMIARMWRRRHGKHARQAETQQAQSQVF